MAAEEGALLAERGVTVAVNTSSNLRLRSGVAPVERFMRHGLAFGFGLDGCAHDDDQDFFRDLRLAWRLHNGTGLEPALPPGRLFDAACRHGFRCIDGSDDYGEVVPGARADLVMLDYARLTEDFLTPEQDEGDIVLARATSRHVRDLFVAGHRVVRRRRPPRARSAGRGARVHGAGETGRRPRHGAGSPAPAMAGGCAGLLRWSTPS